MPCSADTVLVSIMHANNEIGVLQDIAAIGALAAQRDVPLHVDAAQSAGKVDDRRWRAGRCDLLSLHGAQALWSQGHRRAVRQCRAARARCSR